MKQLLYFLLLSLLAGCQLGNQNPELAINPTATIIPTVPATPASTSTPSAIPASPSPSPSPTATRTATVTPSATALPPTQPPTATTAAGPPMLDGWIAFLVSPDSSSQVSGFLASQVLIMTPDGTEIQKVGTGCDRLVDMEWSPDGTTLAYAGACTDTNGDGVIATTGAADPKDNDDPLVYLANIQTDKHLSVPVPRVQLVEWSPTQNYIVAQGLDSPEGKKLYVIDAKTGHYLWVGVGENPAWSPSGEVLAFNRDEAGVSRLVLLTTVAWTLEPLTEGIKPAWSPDGQQLAFLSQDTKAVGFLALASRQTKMIPFCRTEVCAGDLAWSPDARYLAIGGVYILDVPTSSLEYFFGAYEVKWSPNGRFLAFFTGDVVVWDREQNAIRNLSNSEPAVERFFTWSPESSHIVYTSMVQDQETRLYLSDMQGNSFQIPLPSDLIVLGRAVRVVWSDNPQQERSE